MKLSNLRLKSKSNSGIILITVLWVLVILTILAVGLGRSTHVDLSLTRHAIGKLKAKYLAWAGIHYAMGKIKADTDVKESSQQDTLYYCAITMNDGHSPHSLFQNKELGEGHFDVHYETEDTQDGAAQVHPGMRDEERKININAIIPNNKDILIALLTGLNIDVETAKIVAHSIIDWKDTDSTVIDAAYGAENDFYMTQERPYNCKNRPFDLKSELLLVRGVSQEIYQKMEPYITVFPKEGNLKVNFETATPPVLQALLRSMSGPKTNTEESDADTLVNKLLDYRRGSDGRDFTRDDRIIEFEEVATNAKEKILFFSINPFRTKRSDYINIGVDGVEAHRGIRSHANAIVRRGDLKIVYWHRN